jgi:hypothetical protein
MAFLLKLETEDGAPAEPPTLSTAALTGVQETRSRWVTGHCVLFAFATTTQINRRCWSLRTWPDESLTSGPDVSPVKKSGVGPLGKSLGPYWQTVARRRL